MSRLNSTASAAKTAVCPCCKRTQGERLMDAQQCANRKTLNCPTCGDPVPRPEQLPLDQIDSNGQFVGRRRSTRLRPLHQLTYQGSGGYNWPRGRSAVRARY